MKKSLLILILLLVSSIILVGCQPSVGGNHNEETGDNDSASSDSESDNSDANDNSDDNPQNTEIPDNNEEKNDAPLPEIGTRVGDRFADVSLATIDGKSINTADLRGKIVILNIWATWCPPCKAELPDFNRIATEYKDDVVIIAADVDAGQGDAYAYVQQNFPKTDIVFAYDTSHNDAYKAAGGDGYVPYTAIMDQNGVIIYTDSGILSYERLTGIIEDLLK